jgi:hypothetical protein
VDAFIEEAVVRRELSDNYCFYTPEYDTMAACFDWARDSLNKHRDDEREHVYTRCAFGNRPQQCSCRSRCRGEGLLALHAARMRHGSAWPSSHGACEMAGHT